jgi:hypothetical protein
LISTLSKSSDDASSGRTEQRPLIHPLSAALLIAVDGLWTFVDWAALALMVTIPLSFLTVCVPTYLIQKHLKGDPAGRSMAVASFRGVLAAIPTPITGTLVGGIALGLAGIRSLQRLLLH